MKFGIYLIEAITRERSTESVRRKVQQSYMRNPDIMDSIQYATVKVATTAQSFKTAIEEYVAYQEAGRENQECLEILWISVHGGRKKPVEGIITYDNLPQGVQGIEFDNEDYLDWLQAIGPLEAAALDNVILLLSICEGGMPGPPRVLSLAQKPAKFIFGPKINVRVPALHHAEREILLTLSAAEDLPHMEKWITVIDDLNKWGGAHHEDHEQYYRIWADGGKTRYPA